MGFEAPPPPPPPRPLLTFLPQVPLKSDNRFYIFIDYILNLLRCYYLENRLSPISCLV